MFEKIAVVGIGCRFPGGIDGKLSYWNALTENVDAISSVRERRWQDHNLFFNTGGRDQLVATDQAGLVADIEGFDARFFGISPREAMRMDPQHRLLLEVVWQAIEDANLSLDRLSKSSVATFGALGGDDYAKQLFRKLGDDGIDQYFATGNATSPAVGRIAQIFGFNGPAISVDTACSSSAVAVHLACRSLQSGDCDVALAGGVNLLTDPGPSIALSRAQMLSPDGRCKVFDKDANGYVRSEGCGIVVLKRLSDAIEDGDRIVATIAGSAINHDGKSASLTTPKGPSQSAVIEKALSEAGISPTDVQYVEAHGTGTSLGDPIELNALEASYGRFFGADRRLLIGSVKANIGHCEAAAGIAAVIKAALVVQRGQVPDQVHFSEPNPHFDIGQSGLAVVSGGNGRNTKDSLERAGVSSFGFSGTNCHLVVERYHSEKRFEANPVLAPVLTISGKTKEALTANLAQFSERLTDLEGDRYEEFAVASATGRTHWLHRFAAVAVDGRSAREEVLTEWNERQDGSQLKRAIGSEKAAFMFSGQGEQYRDMARPLFEEQPAFRAAFDECGAIILKRTGIELQDVLYGERAELFDQALWTQLSLFTVQYSIAKMWMSLGVMPSAVTGHSLGEFAAAAISEAYDLPDVISLVMARSHVMEQLPADSGMAFVLASHDEVLSWLSGYDKLSLAAVNAPRQISVSGDAQQLAQFCQAAEEKGVVARMLPPAVKGYHSPLLDPLLGALDEQLGAISANEPNVPWLSSASLDWMSQGDLHTGFWKKHMREPVFFHDALRSLVDEGLITFLEIGPSNVLCGLGSRGKFDDQAVFLPTFSKQKTLEVPQTAAKLFTRGVDLDWQEYAQCRNERDIDLPTYPFQRSRYWLDQLETPSAPAPAPAPSLSNVDQSDNADTAKMEDYYGALTQRDSGIEDQEGSFIRFAPFKQVIPGFSWLKVHAESDPDDPHFQEAKSARERMWQNLFNGVDFDAVSRIGDIGCGFGADSLRLAEEHREKSVKGLNISADQVGFAQEKARKAGLENVEFARVDIARQTIEDRFDFALALQVFHHIKDKDAALSNVSSAMNPGGYLVIAEVMASLIDDVDHTSSTAHFSPVERWAEHLSNNRLRIAHVDDLSEEIANYLYDPGFEDRLKEFAGDAGEEVIEHLRGPHLLHGLLSKKIVRYLVVQCVKEQLSDPARLLKANRSMLQQKDRVSESDLPALVETSGTDIVRKALGKVTGMPLRDIQDDLKVADLGLDSLMALELKQLLESTSDKKIPISEILSDATVGDIQSLFENAETSSLPPSSSTSIVRSEDRFAPFPMSDIQQAYWVGRRSDIRMGGVGAHFYAEFERHEWDIDLLEKAWNAVVSRHEMLRTVIQDDGTQRLSESVGYFRFERHDLTDADEESINRTIEDIRARLSHEIRDLASWPPFSIEAAELPDGSVRIFFSIDIVFVDAMSAFQIGREWQAIYEDPGLELPLNQIEFQDVMRVLEERKGQPAYLESLGYWRDREDQLPRAPQLPVKDFSTQQQKSEFSRLADRLDSASLATLKRRAEQNRVTLSMVLLTAYATILGRWSTEPDFTIALTLYNRPGDIPGIERIVGDFTSINLLEIRLDGEKSFAENLKAVRSQLIDDLEHSDVSGIEVLREFNRSSQSSRTASFPIVFTSALSDKHSEVESSGASWLSTIDFGITQTPQVLLDHAAYFLDGELAYHWDLLADAFYPGVPEAMFSGYGALLQRLADDDNGWDAPLEVNLPEAQADCRSLPGPADQLSEQERLDELFLETARAQPESLALICSERTVSYAELDDFSNRVAHQIIQKDLPTGSPIAVVMAKGWKQAVAVLAIQRAGHFYVPISGEMPQQRQERIVTGAAIQLVVSDDPAIAQRFDLPCVEIPDDVEGLSEPSRAIRSDEGALATAYVIYTSGTTGTPKGVEIQHFAAANTIRSVNEGFGISAKDRVLGISSLAFDLSVFDFFGSWAAGACVVLTDPSPQPDPEAWMDLVTEHGVTVWNSVPALFEMFLETAQRNRRPTNLRLAMLSGDWIPVALPDRARERFSDFEVVSLGGATEASIWSIFYPIKQVHSEWTSIPYGKPLAGQWLDVRNSRMERQPDWAVGEIIILGHGLAAGYRNDPELTAEKFIHDPISGQRAYRTGDLGMFDADGNIRLLGRMDSQVKILGHRIELGEIEAAAESLLPISRAVAHVRPDPNGNTRLILFYVGEAEIDKAGASEALSALLPEHMLPHLYMRVSDLPLSFNGKVARENLPDPEWKAATEGQAITTEIGLSLIRLWEEVLGSAPVSDGDNFLELGGDSLKATRLLSNIHQAFGVEIPISQIYELPVFADQERRISELLASVETTSIRDSRGTGAWYNAIVHSSTKYSIHTVQLLVEGRVCDVRLAEAMRVCASLLSWPTNPFPTNGSSDTQSLSSSEVAERLFVETASLSRSFDEGVGWHTDELFSKLLSVDEGRLLHAAVVEDCDGQVLVAFAFHPWLVDGASAELFVREILSAYNRLGDGRRPAYTTDNAALTEIASKRLARSNSQDVHEQERRLLRAALEFQSSKTVEEADGNVVPQFAFQSRTLQPKVVAKLTNLARERRTGKMALLLSTIIQAFESGNKKTSACVGLNMVDHRIKGASGKIGAFDTVLPVFISHDPGKQSDGLCRSVKRALQAAYTFRDVPLERTASLIGLKGASSATFDFCFRFIESPPVQGEFEGQSFKQIISPQIMTGSPLQITIRCHGTVWNVSVAFDTNIHTLKRIESLFDGILTAETV